MYEEWGYMWKCVGGRRSIELCLIIYESMCLGVCQYGHQELLLSPVPKRITPFQLINPKTASHN